jgi:hypothetical protein
MELCPVCGCLLRLVLLKRDGFADKVGCASCCHVLVVIDKRVY